MERPGSWVASIWKSDSNRQGNSIAIEVSTRVVYDLVESVCLEIGELHFHDRAHAFQAGSDHAADHGVFADGRI